MQARQESLNAALTSERFAALPQDIARLIEPLVVGRRCAYVCNPAIYDPMRATLVTAHIINERIVKDASVPLGLPHTIDHCFLSWHKSLLRVCARGGEQIYPSYAPMHSNPEARVIGKQIKFVRLEHSIIHTADDYEYPFPRYRFLTGIDTLDTQWVLEIDGGIYHGTMYEGYTQLPGTPIYHGGGRVDTTGYRLPTSRSYAHEGVWWVDHTTVLSGVTDLELFDIRTGHRMAISDPHRYAYETSVHEERIHTVHSYDYPCSHIEEYDRRAARWSPRYEIPEGCAYKILFY